MKAKDISIKRVVDWLREKGWHYEVITTKDVYFKTRRGNTFEFEGFSNKVIKYGDPWKRCTVRDFSGLCEWIEENDQ